MQHARRWITVIGLALFALPLHAGVGVWTSNGPFGARAQDAVFHPLFADIAYAATLEGVFKTVDGGATWSPSNMDPMIEIFSLEIDPATPSTLYAAGVFRLFKTTDAGATWFRVEAGLPDAVRFHHLAIDPTDSNVIYVGTSDEGLFKSIDGAASWTAINNGLPVDIRHVTVDPTTPSTLWAAAPAGGYRSLDAGASWNRLLDVGPVHSIAIDPKDGDRIYAGTSFGLYQSVDGGSSWMIRNPSIIFDVAFDWQTPTAAYATSFAGGVLKTTDGGQTWNDASLGLFGERTYRLAVAPSDASKLLVGADVGIFESGDRGQLWTERNQGLAKPVITDLAIDPADAGVLYVTTLASGLFKSVDGGKTWTRKIGLPTFDLPSVTQAVEDPRHVFVATFDHRVVRSTDAGETWTSASTGLPGDSVFALLAVPGGAIFAITFDDSVYRTDNDGGLWLPANQGIAGTAGSRLVVDPRDPATLFLASSLGADGVHKTADAGATWTAMSNGLTSTSVFDLGLVPSAPDTLYAESNAGWFKTTNGGALWTPLPDQWRGSGIAFDPHDADTIYLAGRGVRKTTDGGATFLEISEGLPLTSNATPLFSTKIVVDPHQPLRLWLATQRGIYERSQALFLDDFESGDTHAWSTTVP